LQPAYPPPLPTVSGAEKILGHLAFLIFDAELIKSRITNFTSSRGYDYVMDFTKFLGPVFGHVHPYSVMSVMARQRCWAFLH
jgi:hypothetical protein